MKKLILLAILLRLLVAVFYFHPDIKTFNYQSSFLREGVFNIYNYLDEHKAELPLKEEFVYFPLTYISLGVYQIATSPFFGSHFVSWLASASASTYTKDPYIFRYLMLLKLPYLLLDLAIGYMLFTYFEDRVKAKKALILWLFNPFTIVLFYIFANIDIIPVALTVMAFTLIKKDKLLASSGVLALAAGFKLYPLLFIPFLALETKDTKNRIALIAVPLLIFALIIAPFFSRPFIESALVSGLSTRIFNPSFSVGFGESLILGFFGVSVLFFYKYAFAPKVKPMYLWIAVFLFIFSFSHFHIQWLSWIAPFLVILVVEKPSLKWLVGGMSALAFLIPPLYEDRSMTLDLMRVYTNYFDILPTPNQFLQNIFDPYSIQSILHTMFAAGNLIIICKLFLNKKNK